MSKAEPTCLLYRHQKGICSGLFPLGTVNSSLATSWAQGLKAIDASLRLPRREPGQSLGGQSLLCRAQLSEELWHAELVPSGDVKAPRIGSLFVCLFISMAVGLASHAVPSYLLWSINCKEPGPSPHLPAHPQPASLMLLDPCTCLKIQGE